MSSSKQILILWHSRTGGSKLMAQAAVKGIEYSAQLLETPLLPRMLAVQHVIQQDFIQADAYIFCAPENLGSLSGAMKECLDIHYYPLLDRLNGRPYQSFICAGSDGQGARAQLDRIVTGWRLQKHRPGFIWNTHAQTPEDIFATKHIPASIHQHCHDLAADLAANVALSLI